MLENCRPVFHLILRNSYELDFRRIINNWFKIKSTFGYIYIYVTFIYFVLKFI